MSNEQVNNQNAGHGSFEHQDLSPKPIFYFLVGLAVALVLIYFIVLGVYHVLGSLDTPSRQTMSPMVAPKADTRAVTPGDIQAFPQPRLEQNERTQLGGFILDEDRKLESYDWVDKDKGILQIPIDRAMDLIVQRGLPVRPQGKTPEKDQQQQTPQKEGSSAK
jgi:hypothetical protein